MKPVRIAPGASRTALQLLALAAAQTMPRVLRATTNAAHGPDGDRRVQLQQAKHHITELLGRLELAEIQLERELADNPVKEARAS